MRIDLNADLGESYGAWSMGDDASLLDLVTSANIATGFHAGDPATLLRTVRLAADQGVSIGAHLGYRDRDGFGRRFIDIDPSELHAETVYQLGAIEAACRVNRTTLNYVKPHGALYHAITTNRGQAEAVVSAVAAFSPKLPLLGLPDTVATDLAQDYGLPTRVEAFADRGYTAQGGLVPRGEPGALLHDPDEVAARVVSLVRTGSVATADGTEVELPADSICVHGDSPNAVAMATAIRQALVAAGIELRAFVDPPASDHHRGRAASTSEAVPD